MVSVKDGNVHVIRCNYTISTCYIEIINGVLHFFTSYSTSLHAVPGSITLRVACCLDLLQDPLHLRLHTQESIPSITCSVTQHTLSLVAQLLLSLCHPTVTAKYSCNPAKFTSLVKLALIPCCIKAGILRRDS